MNGWEECDLGLVEWLKKPDSGQLWTGLSGGRFADSIWILNPLYEHPEHESLTHDDVHRYELEAGLVEPTFLDESPTLVSTGGSLGRMEAPGEPWRRVRWRELAARTGDPMVSPGEYPCHHCFPSMHPRSSWPISVAPPTEGSLDREGWRRLVEVLTAASADGEATRCVAFWAGLVTWDWSSPIAMVGTLADAVELYDYSAASASPSNLFAIDRSWATWTDVDLWGTRVAGPVDLIAAVEADDQLETIRLPDVDERDMRRS